MIYLKSDPSNERNRNSFNDTNPSSFKYFFQNKTSNVPYHFLLAFCCQKKKETYSSPLDPQNILRSRRRKRIRGRITYVQVTRSKSGGNLEGSTILRTWFVSISMQQAERNNIHPWSLISYCLEACFAFRDIIPGIVLLRRISILLNTLYIIDPSKLNFTSIFDFQFIINISLDKRNYSIRE